MEGPLYSESFHVTGMTASELLPLTEHSTRHAQHWVLRPSKSSAALGAGIAAVPVSQKRGPHRTLPGSGKMSLPQELDSRAVIKMT